MKRKKRAAIAIRQMRLSDFPKVIRISNQAFIELPRRPSYLQLTLQQYCAAPKWSLVAAAGKKLAGFLCASPKGESQCVTLNLIAIHPAFQGLGIGTRLMACLEYKAVQNEFTAIITGTPYAGPFYKKNGFKLTKIESKLIKDIAQKTIPEPKSSFEVRCFDVDDMERVLKELPAEQAETMLRTYLANYRDNRQITIAAFRKGRPVGVVCGAIHDLDRDFASMDYLYTRSARTRGLLIKQFEYECSKQGLRRVGAASSDAQWTKKLNAMGYKDTGYDYWSTSHHMRKELA